MWIRLMKSFPLPAFVTEPDAVLPARAAKKRRSPQMAAAVIVAPGRVEIRTALLPEPGPRQVRIKLEGCGVCRSTVSAWAGQSQRGYAMPPGAPGREGWGGIDAVGADVVGFEPGERVAFLSERAYAEYDIAEVDGVVRLPESLDGEPFPAEPLAGVVNVFRRAHIEKGETVAIVGIGFLGALLTQLAVLSQARVIALGRRPSSLLLAESMGAAHTIPLGTPEDRGMVKNAVEQFTGGALCDIVIEATGKQAPLDLSGELTRERGRLVVAGCHHDGPRHVDMQLWNWRGLDVINAHEHSRSIYLEGMREAVGAVASGLLAPQPLFTHRFGLADLGTALQMCMERPEGFMKGLILFE